MSSSITLPMTDDRLPPLPPRPRAGATSWTADRPSASIRRVSGEAQIAWAASMAWSMPFRPWRVPTQ